MDYRFLPHLSESEFSSGQNVVNTEVDVMFGCNNLTGLLDLFIQTMVSSTQATTPRASSRGKIGNIDEGPEESDCFL